MYFFLIKLVVEYIIFSVEEVNFFFFEDEWILRMEVVVWMCYKDEEEVGE